MTVHDSSDITSAVPDDPTPADTLESWSTTRVLAIGAVCALFIALSVTAQTYLSMLGHGHSFWRMLLWQLSVSGLWALMAPALVRLGAAFHSSGTGARRAWLQVLAAALISIALHMAVTALVSLYLLPFVPVVVTDWLTAFRAQFESQFATDILVFTMLIGLGRVMAVNARANRLALRESRLEAELARAHLEALRLEIQPHFLFNTLNSIAALIRMQANQKALDMLLGLSSLMRATVDRPATQLTPLSAELEFVRQYLDLQSVRFGDRLDVDFSVDDASLPMLVPSFLLQPLVENALRHGVSRKAGRSRLAVTTAVIGAFLHVVVDDDGAGLPPGFDLAKDAGTGLRNIRVRLQQLYGQSASLTINAAPLEGTQVVIVLPANHVSASAQARETA